MKKIFVNDFTEEGFYNWRKEQHVPDGYSDFIIRNGAMVMHDAGNRLLPTIPSLRNLSVKGSFETDWHANYNKFSLQIYLNYDLYKRKGLVLDIHSDGEKLTVSLINEDQLIKKQEINKKVFSNITLKKLVEFDVLKIENELSLFLDSEKCFSHKVDAISGFLALGRGVFVGELRLKSFEIASNDKFKEEIIWENLSIPFEPINGMDDSIIWTISARKTGEIIQLDVELSGGVNVRPNIEWFRYRDRYIEELGAPYLRLESLLENIDLPLSAKTLTLCNQPPFFFYQLGNDKPEWPFKKSFSIMPFDYENAMLFCGYKSYCNKSVNKHQAASRCETAYDCRTGKVVYYGEALNAGSLVVNLKSGENKQICRDIPKASYKYEKALRFAKENHYFSENEKCNFYFELFSRMGKIKNELRLEYCLQDAFFNPLRKYKKSALKRTSSIGILDIEKMYSKEITLRNLKPGVYHLSFRLFQGNILLLEKCRAFEIYSQKLGGTEASRLPKMFSFTTENMGQDSDYFNPWKPDCIDISHYISIGVSIMPHFAREMRLWELYKLYKRKWFLWLTNRTTEDYDLNSNRDIVKHCDYLQSPNALGEVSLFRLCSRGFYSGPLLKILYEFAVKNNFYSQKIKDAVDNNSVIDRNTFDELVSKYFYKWISFFCDKFIELMRQKKRHISEINNNAEYSDYGPVAIYSGAYKTAHSTLYIGGLKHSKEIEKIYNGFFIFEDYPYPCRYNINRGPFLLASIKKIYPKLKLYPELYSPSGNTCLDAAVARAWPSVGKWGGNEFSVNFSVKRALEYVYATVWHDGNNFNYWQDYGFQTRAWEQERYTALLKTWGVIDKIKAYSPLKANVFICNEECCLNHEIFYDEYPIDDEHMAFGDLFNTAEENIPYAYEMSRNAGQNAGFVADFDALKKLDAKNIDTLIIPPLTKVSSRDLENIRCLHERGVSLLAFEEVGGLEDLFGVKEDEMKQVNNIMVNKNLSWNPLIKLANIQEYTEHRACKGKYLNVHADVLLDGEVPVLFTNKTKWGKTALFNIPPTTVRRQDQPHRVCYGRDNISILINESSKLLLKYLSNPAVETDIGKIISFIDTKGNTHIIIEEDAHPLPATAITPLLSINLPGLKKKNISCDKEFSIVSITEKSAKIRLKLDPDEFAILTLT